jgi:uncharacterized protein
MKRSDGSSKTGDYRMRVTHDLRTLDAVQWDRLLAESGPNATPFMRHAFLLALQETGCVGDGTGWTPRIACLEDAAGTLVGAAPLYLKSHSYGEYVFDWAWADAYHRHGLEYYPKGLVAVPFTPVPGPRLLARDDAIRQALVKGLEVIADGAELSSLHVLFPDEPGARALEGAGWLARRGLQFHWTNPGYADFEAFLAALAQPKRKKIRAERRKVAEAGVATRVLEGRDIGEAQWAFFSQCYRNTYAMHHSTPYLNHAFFTRIGEAMPENLVMVIAERDDQAIAASLLVRDASAIYGRYWGALEHVPCLHFEASYYTPLEWAIAQGISRFEGGAQGEHKMARGFLPVQTSSYHRLAHPAFAEAVSRFLEREAGGIDDYLDELTERAPIRSAPKG